MTLCLTQVINTPMYAPPMYARTMYAISRLLTASASKLRFVTENVTKHETIAVRGQYI